MAGRHEDEASLQRARRIDAILDRLLDLDGDARETALRDAAGDDAELERQLRRLLQLAESEATHLSPGAPLQQGFAAGLGGEERVLAGGARLGRYRVVEEIGRGGMSVVYLAEQEAEGFVQNVAVKQMRLLGEHGAMAQRFLRERRILALLRHPDIAGIIDVGSDADGRPFIVMEYVDGQPIDRYCDAWRLDLRERLKLFCRVAAAVAFAHTNLVVHRDIKPSNVLVDRHGHTKLLDFGIAKLLGDSDASQVTATAREPQTPAYASPEQVRGEVTTTASDVYQLGLLLYLLACGRLPYETAGVPAEALARRILAGDLPAPSRRLLALDGASASDIAGQRGEASVPALARQLGGDFDVVAMRALAADPQRRYPSVGHLLDDVQRFLAGRPISARPDTIGYRFGKLVRRHRTASALVATLALALLAAIILLLGQTLELRQARDSAEREAALANEVLDYMITMFRSADPDRSRGGDLKVRDVLDASAPALAERFAERPEAEHRLRLALAEVYESLGLFDAAMTHVQRSTELAGILEVEQRGGAQFASGRVTARLLLRTGRYEEAQPLLEHLIEQAPQHGDDRTRLGLISNLTGVLAALNKPLEAIELGRRALAMRLASDGWAHPETLRAAGNQAVILSSRIAGEPPDPKLLAEALRLSETIVEVAPRLLGADSPAVLDYRAHHAQLLTESGHAGEALALLDEVLVLMRDRLGADHPRTRVSERHRGSALLELGRDREALEALEPAVASLATRLPASHPSLGYAWLELARARARLGDRPGAMQAVDAALNGEIHPRSARRAAELAPLLETAPLAERIRAIEASISATAP